VDKISHCEIEIDAQASAVLNRRRLKGRNMHHLFEEKDLIGGDSKLVPSLIGLWEEEQRRRMKNGLSATIPPPKSVESGRLLTDGEHPHWQAHDRLWQFIDARLKQEDKAFQKDGPKKETFTSLHPFEKYIVTAFDSVDIFHPKSKVAASQGDPENPYSSQLGGSRVGKDGAREATGSPKLFAAEHLTFSFSTRSREESSDSKRTASGSKPSTPLKTQQEEVAVSQEDVQFFQSQLFQEQLRQVEESWQEKPDEMELDGEEDEVKESTTPQTTPSRRGPRATFQTPTKSPLRKAVDNPFVTPTKRPAESKHSSVAKLSSSASWKLSRSAKSSSRKTRVKFADTLEVASSSPSAGHVPARPAYQYAFLAPTKEEVMDSFAEFDLSREEHVAPFYSNPEDVPEKAREYAGRSFTFKSITLPFLSEFDHYTRDEGALVAAVGGAPRMRSWEFSQPLPSRQEVKAWAHEEETDAAEARKRRKRRLASQIEKMTQQQADSTYGFKVSQYQPTSLIEREKQHMTTLAIEVHACSRRELLPDPETDAIDFIAYSFQNEDETLEDTGSRAGLRTGVIVVARDGMSAAKLGLRCEVHEVQTEDELFACLVAIVRRFDPEILVGYEIHNGSWGYVVQRAARLSLDMVLELGRVKEGSTGAAKGKDDNWGYTQTSALRITGRHVLNIWRLMRGEVALTQYTYENIVFHLLHRRVPKFSPATLTAWYRATSTPELLARVLEYFLSRAETALEIIDSSELVFRTSEFARIYGVDFFSVLSRGSQFKVESVMFRISKPENFLLPSPSRMQVASQNAAECIPLIMEPQSAFFKGPLVVVDFQSLYPSIMIAYNICYSTCLGRVTDFKGTQKFGFTEFSLPKGMLTLLKDDIKVSPNGMIYVQPHIRRSLLAKMLNEILDTRVMLKGSMKGVKDDKTFLRLQNARQLSLKLLANVTYGYTSASYSGRMPCVELADSIVQYGRETLERAVQLIESEPKWGAKVVYGDTDSLFIYLEGRTKDDAFKIGHDIADTVTAHNPKPVKLKFEKVYLPSVLLAKKRYVGYKFEHPEDEVPTFDAKGIETVRRDGNAALQRIQEACIRILFRTRDLSQVKSFLQRQWQKILEGRVNMQDFIVAKEVRLGTYSDKVAPPPGAAVATRKMMLDPRAEPQHAERVPYIISQGEPKARLNDQAVSPEIMLANP
jgi:DNA polymerase zeta